MGYSLHNCCSDGDRFFYKQQFVVVEALNIPGYHHAPTCHCFLDIRLQYPLVRRILNKYSFKKFVISGYRNQNDRDYVELGYKHIKL